MLTHFSKAEHQLLLPLWPAADGTPEKTFTDLLGWHRDAFGDSRLSGARLEESNDRAAWAEASGLDI